MKQLIPLIFSLAILGLFLIGCESISDPEPVSDALFSTGETSGLGTLSGGITKEMCKNDPGWKALGFRNQGQCIRYVETGQDSRPGVTDIDGNVYRTVTIGDQLWMAENLRTTRYSDGTPIPTGLDNTQWINTTAGAYAIYSHESVEGINSEEGMVDAYGILYNWYAVDDDRGLCPVGWHVPTDAEWTMLVDYVEAQGYPNELFNPDGAGTALKSRRQVDNPLDGGIWATDEHPRWDSYVANYGQDVFGFSGLPGGIRDNLGGYSVIGLVGAWWSSSEANTYDAWYRYLSRVLGNVNRFENGKDGGLSVRCLRD